MKRFAEIAGQGLPTLSYDMDHTTLLIDAHKETERMMWNSGWQGGEEEDPLGEALWRHITSHLEFQRKELERKEEEAANAEKVPPGWLRVENRQTKKVSYIHEATGQFLGTLPIHDPQHPGDWVKVKSRSREGDYSFFNPRTGKRQTGFPTTQSDLLLGWTKLYSPHSGTPGKIFYHHTETGVSQLERSLQSPVQTGHCGVQSK